MELHTNYRKLFQLESGKLLWTFLTWMMTKSISYEDSLAHFRASELLQLLSSLFCAIFPIVSTCHPMTLLGAKSYLGLPPPHCAHGFTRLQMSGSLTIARRVGSATLAPRRRHSGGGSTLQANQSWLGITLSPDKNCIETNVAATSRGVWYSVPAPSEWLHSFSLATFTFSCFYPLKKLPMIIAQCFL